MEVKTGNMQSNNWKLQKDQCKITISMYIWNTFDSYETRCLKNNAVIIWIVFAVMDTTTVKKC